MSMPKKGSRKIVVDGEVYHWRVGKDFSPGWEDTGSVIVEELSGNIFRAVIPACYAAPKSHPRSEYHPNAGAIPSVIADLIRHPEKRKWRVAPTPEEIAQRETESMYRELFGTHPERVALKEWWKATKQELNIAKAEILKDAPLYGLKIWRLTRGW